MMNTIGKSPALQSRIVQPIISMAREVESMIDLAIESLLSFNVEMAGAILQKEPAINTTEMKIDSAIFAVLEKGDLTLQEIRQAASMLKINKDLERMADLAANIGRKINSLAGRGKPQDYSELQPMAIAVSHISRKTLRALIHGDQVLAANAVGGGATVDFYRDYVFRKLQERVKPGSESPGDINLMLASRYLEQIADHSVNVAGHLIFWLDGRKTGDRPCRQAVAV
ncbi:MAG TPA: PhoU domain-containing protein [Candidatus Solibacter sp.]|jgi:phosphate transport system protein|nr:PhoU domain-containing protein [Candidatus Solibacter sp.]